MYDPSSTLDISINAFDNFSTGTLLDFANSYENGRFANYASTTLEGYFILKDDSLSPSPRNPAIAAFIQSSFFCKQEITVLTQSNPLEIWQRAILNAMIYNVNEYICVG